MSTPSSPARPSTPALGVLFVSALSTACLAVYQWVELLVVREGGKVACALNETVNCATVWNSAFASAVHEALGMPVAALGAVWGVAAMGLVALLWRKATTEDWPVLATATKLWALGGVGSIVVLGWASYSARAVCLTCLGTYGLVLAFSIGAFAMLPPPRWPQSGLLLGGAAWVFVVGAPTFLLALTPGGQTPRAGQVTKLAGTSERELVEALMSMPAREKVLTAAARTKWMEAASRDTREFVTRVRHGPPNALIRVVEFSDVLCPHCASFEQSLEELRRAAPEGSLSIEPRLFPLVEDGCAGPAEPGSPKEVRCVGAKAQICSESHPLYWNVRKALFSRQQQLHSAGDVLEAVSGVTGVRRDELLACVNSPETQKKLADDITYAKRFDVRGTPLVLLNDKETWPSQGFILGMAVGRGDVNAPWFRNLPPPPPME